MTRIKRHATDILIDRYQVTADEWQEYERLKLDLCHFLCPTGFTELSLSLNSPFKTSSLTANRAEFAITLKQNNFQTSVQSKKHHYIKPLEWEEQEGHLATEN